MIWLIQQEHPRGFDLVDFMWNDTPSACLYARDAADVFFSSMNACPISVQAPTLLESSLKAR